MHRSVITFALMSRGVWKNSLLFFRLSASPLIWRQCKSIYLFLFALPLSMSHVAALRCREDELTDKKIQSKTHVLIVHSKIPVKQLAKRFFYPFCAVNCNWSWHTTYCRSVPLALGHSPFIWVLKAWKLCTE